MYQVPASVLNQILESQPLKTTWAEKLFAMDQDELNEALEDQAQALEAHGVPDPVAIAYQKIAPVLAEQEAITAFIEETGNMMLRGSLPDVTTADEAVMVMTEEHRLTPEQAEQLHDMLKQLSMR